MSEALTVPQSSSDVTLNLSGEDGKAMKVSLTELGVRSHIAAGDEFEGELRCATGIRISGTVKGSVTCNSGAIVVEKGGHVTGSLTGKDQILIDGTVGPAEGSNSSSVQITSPGMISLFNNAVVDADIHYGKLSTYGDMTHNGNMKKSVSR